jgi:hypothetical protein
MASTTPPALASGYNVADKCVVAKFDRQPLQCHRCVIALQWHALPPRGRVQAALVMATSHQN